MVNKKPHGRSNFFKYATAETALLVINSRKFRWSSPLQFNDPFDHQTGFAVDATPEQVADFVVASADRLIYGNSEILVRNRVTEFVAQVRNEISRIDRDASLCRLRGAFLSEFSKFDKYVEKFNEQLVPHMTHSRVFCVSETHDNVVMWSHYADQHRGVTFKLRCIEKLTMPFSQQERLNMQHGLCHFAMQTLSHAFLRGRKRLISMNMLGIWPIQSTPTGAMNASGDCTFRY